MQEIKLICCECALEIGGRYIEKSVSYKEDVCDRCRKHKVVTEPLDYGLVLIDPDSIRKYRELTKDYG